MSIVPGLLYPEICGVHMSSFFSRYSSAGCVYFKFPVSVGDAACTGPRTDVLGGQAVGQERLVLIPPVPPLSCAT